DGTGERLHFDAQGFLISGQHGFDGHAFLLFLLNCRADYSKGKDFGVKKIHSDPRNSIINTSRAFQYSSGCLAHRHPLLHT
ncbi:MAG TPA: hypothetical protein VII93_03030, partial [Anaerolineales bacterium]